MDEVRRQGVLPPGYELDLMVAETYGQEEESILQTARLWTQNISAYIGPQETCIHEARMAAAFRLPMISYVSPASIYRFLIHDPFAYCVQSVEDRQSRDYFRVHRIQVVNRCNVLKR